MFKWLEDARKLPIVEAERDDAVRRMRQIEAASLANLSRANAAERAHEELKGKLREQNEADLLMTSMQIVHRLTAGEKKDSPTVMGLLQQQAAMQQNMAMAQGMAGGLGGILGNLGNPFSLRA